MFMYTSASARRVGDLTGRYEMRFPTDERGMDQDEAWCEVKLGGKWQRLRFHDYADIYNVPGLYESLFYRRLRCNSPKMVVSMLAGVAADQPPNTTPTMSSLRVLDLGAGNGMVGAELLDAGARHVTGIDLIPEARDAAERDRPWVYDQYHVADLCDLPEDVEKSIRSAKLNALTCVAALGFGDIPRRAFMTGLDMIETPGWLSFNLKENFLRPGETSGFAGLIHELANTGVIQIEAYRRYQHRLSYRGEPLYYVAVVARKLDDVPDKFLER